MTLLDTPTAARAELTGRGCRLHVGAGVADLHPHWLRDRTSEPGSVDATNRQRLFTPLDVPADLRVTAVDVVGDLLVVDFSDGHRAHLVIDAIARDLGWRDDPEAPPEPEPWTAPFEPLPVVPWSDVGWRDDEADPDAVLTVLHAFYRRGFVVLRETPVVPGSVARVANRFGYISGQNFGWVFDVRTEPDPTDLAYTSIGLLAHTDLPYRKEPPGIQLLHCIANDAPGGDSTLVDGLAAAQEMRVEEPDLFRAMADTEVEFRYDMGTDTVVDCGPVFELDRLGRLRRIRFNTKLDLPLPRSDVDLDAWYAGRRWLTRWLNDPAHRLTFRLRPGDVVFMDNRRVLHGRTAFDPTQGGRHLQGCYIGHDGPDTMHRLTTRRRNAGSGS